MEPISEGDLSWAKWYAQYYKRWPMTLGVWLGVVMAIHATAVGYGYQQAQKQLPLTRAAVIARNQPPVPDERNAAVVYAQATQALVPWRKIAERYRPNGPEDAVAQDKVLVEPDRLKHEDWRKEETFAPDGALNTYLRENEQALLLIEQAAAMPNVDWGIKGEDFPHGSIKPITNLRTLSKLLNHRCLVEAHAGDWSAAAGTLRLMHLAALQVQESPGILPNLIGTSLDVLTWTTARNALSTPNVKLDMDSTALLRGVASTAMVSRLMVVHRAMVDEWLTCGHLLDQVGCGDFSRITSDANPIPMLHIPRPVSIYSAVYPWDRSGFDHLFRSQLDALAASIEGRPIPSDTPDPERIFFTDPRLVYSRFLGASISGMVCPVFGLITKLERDRQQKWRMLTAALDLHDWIARHKRMPQNFSEADIAAALVTDLDNKNAPMRFRRDDDGCLRLWSVGNNRKDDTTTPPDDRFGRSDDVYVLIPVDLP